jgi:hypothetical protein
MATSMSASRALAKLRRIRAKFGEQWAAEKLGLIQILSKAKLARARDVFKLHEYLLFLRAYPDDATVLAHVEGELARFAQRSDLRRHREALINSGIAGTPIEFSFYWQTAEWLVQRFGQRLSIEWDYFEHEAILIERMPLFVLWSETTALDELDLSPAEWIAYLKSPAESDAEFLVKRVQAMAGDAWTRECFWNELDLMLRLPWGADGPSRTHAYWPQTKTTFQWGSLQRPRPDLRREVQVPPVSIKNVSRKDGERLVAMARDAMVTRERDLDAFVHGDPRDVRIVDCGDNLQFVCIGVKPEQRLLLESVYAFLTLKNGIPIGYVLTSALMESAEIAYNVFDTYRGAEAAHVYARVLAMVSSLFSVDTFTVYPYQLGYDNEEGLKSGAWWFYQKLGFRARDRGVLRIMDRELKRMRRDPAYRSSLETLNKLVPHNVYLDLAQPRDDVIGEFPLEEVGEAVTRLLADRFGADRERATRELSAEAARLLGSPPWSQLPPAERQACERWAPLVACLDVASWSKPQRQALFEVMRAKGGRRESEFVAKFDAHKKLRATFRDCFGSRPSS